MDKKVALSALAALGQETRLDVFRLLVQNAPDGVPAGDIAASSAPFRTPCRRISRSCRMPGWSRSTREGRIVRYVADMTGFRDLLAYLMEDCCNGRPELCRPVIDAVTCDC